MEAANCLNISRYRVCRNGRADRRSKSRTVYKIVMVIPDGLLLSGLFMQHACSCIGGIVDIDNGKEESDETSAKNISVRIHEISDRARETKCWERYSVNFHCIIRGDGKEMMSIYSGVSLIYTPRHSVHLRYPCICEYALGD